MCFFYSPNWFRAKKWAQDHWEITQYYLPQTQSAYERDKKIIQNYFDSSFYVKTYQQEVSQWCKKEKLSPLDHFMQIGWKKRYNPTPWFNTGFYLDHYAKHRNPFVDFLDAPFGLNQEKPNHFMVSMTSYPPRIHEAWLGVQSILRQKFKPDRVVLYLAEDEFPDHNFRVC